MNQVNDVTRKLAVYVMFSEYFLVTIIKKLTGMFCVTLYNTAIIIKKDSVNHFDKSVVKENMT